MRRDLSIIFFLLILIILFYQLHYGYDPSLRKKTAILLKNEKFQIQPNEYTPVGI